MAEKLTPQQETAVHNRGGELLVSAAAGSGKTKVLVDRLMQYLTDPVDPANLDDFLIITYTKAAASELRAKIASKLSEYIALSPENRHLQRQMQRLYLAKISTVHGFCGDLLREFAYTLDLSADFRVADDFECLELQARTMERLLNEAYDHIGEDAQFRALTDSQGLGRNDRQIPDIIMKVYNAAQCHLKPDSWLDWCMSICDVSKVTDAAQTVWGKCLLDDLKNYLELQIVALEKCITLATDAGGMDKPVILLRSTVDQLRVLADCNTWDAVYAHKDIDYGRMVFSSKCPDLELADQIKAVRDACKKGVAKKLRCFADPSVQVLQDISSTTEATAGLVKLVKRFSIEYDRLKRSRRVLDFGDLEHKTLDLLMGRQRSAPTRIAAEIGRRFREIMVDEYQDSNVVQDAIFQALTGKNHNCFMVGDVKQSIYQFRLADPDIFLDKYKRFQHAQEAVAGEGRKVLLSCNFRSSGGVISAVNDVFSLCMSPEVGGLYYGDGEKLVEGIPHVSLSEPEVELHALRAQGDTYETEPAYTAERIVQLLDGAHYVRDGENLRPIVPEDIVILLRSPGSVGNAYKIALERRGIRCTTGSGIDLLHTEEIEVLHAFLQVIFNPLQDIPLITVLSSRVFCFTADDLAALRAGKNYGRIYHALHESDLEKTAVFIKTLSALRAEAKWLTVTQLLNRIFAITRMDSIYSALADGVDRVENIQAFCKIAASFEGTGKSDLCSFLEHVAALDEKGGVSVEQGAEHGAVTIMSIHKSKGLEFPVVFLCALSREFNTESMRAPVLCDKTLGMGLACVDTENRIRYPSIAKYAIASAMKAQSISEEMRVLYVAMTRARDRLIMMYTSENLDGELTSIQARMQISNPLLLTGDVDCPGKWILYAAMHRQEAKQLFDIAGRNPSVHFSENPWSIVVGDGAAASELQQAEGTTKTHELPAAALERIGKGLQFRYPHELATQAPSKQTATQLKGRDKDREAEENTAGRRAVVGTWKKPSFVHTDARGTARGTAMHAAMQYINYSVCTDEDGVKGELHRLVHEQFISQQQADMVDSAQIAAFFSSNIGRQLTSHSNIIREFKFSILEDGSKYYSNMDHERILLQGVVDCAMIHNDGITVIDFKSDRIREEQLDSATEKYRAQLEIYADALSRIYELPVQDAYLYFFELNRFVKIIG